jgi:hypothetical protein
MEKFLVGCIGCLMLIGMLAIGSEIYTYISPPTIKEIDGHEFLVKGFKVSHLEHCSCKKEK